MFEGFAKSGLIEADELQALLNGPACGKVKLLDCSYVLPTTPDDRREMYAAARIGNAQFFDIDEVADHSRDLPHMLPSADVFASALSGLGIGHADLVVLYAQSGMVLGPCRAWWTFRVFGHEHVCILNGGLPAWKAAGLPLREEPPPTPPILGAYSANTPHAVTVDMQEVECQSQNGGALILDARPPERFAGQADEPRPGLKRGHIKSSANIPAGSLVDPETGKFRGNKELAAILAKAGYESGRPVITTCGSGVTACVISFALFRLGESLGQVYDGSWAEWGLPESNKICVLS